MKDLMTIIYCIIGFSLIPILLLQINVLNWGLSLFFIVIGTFCYMIPILTIVLLFLWGKNVYKKNIKKI
jgi:hypothetical protein